MTNDDIAYEALFTPLFQSPGPELAAALVAALAELEELPKDRTANTGTYSYNYAAIDSVLGYVRPILARHDLVQLQPLSGGPDTVTVTTILLHKSGQAVAFEPFTMKGGTTPQNVGSAASYARRYSLLAALGLATEDDDGKAASKPPAATQAPKTRTTTTSTPPGLKPSSPLTKRVMAQFGELDIRDRDDRLAVTSAILGRPVESWKDVSADEASMVTDVLAKRLEGRA